MEDTLSQRLQTTRIRRITLKSTKAKAGKKDMEITLIVTIIVAVITAIVGPALVEYIKAKMKGRSENEDTMYREMELTY